MQIGRRIFFEKATGNLILDTGEREGDVILTTIDQDFAMYAPLQNYLRDAVGVVTIPFAQDREKFAQYRYHIDPATETILWDLTPIQQEEQTKQLSAEARLDALEEQAASSTNEFGQFMDFYFANNPEQA